MCWVGLLAGAYLGSRLGLGPVGSLVGSVLGGLAENRLRARRRASARRVRREPPRDDSFAAACRVLGVPPNASKAEMRRAYREKAKACHPDVLRARGASEREIAEATERMAKINAAWRRLNR